MIHSKKSACSTFVKARVQSGISKKQNDYGAGHNSAVIKTQIGRLLRCLIVGRKNFQSHMQASVLRLLCRRGI